MKLSIIVPVYNEGANISKILHMLNGVEFGIPYEIIVVNDGSTDSTHSELIKTSKRMKNVKAISYEQNKGKGHAIRVGLKNANGNIFVIQDADFEYFPTEIPKLIKYIINNESKVVYGSRFKGHAKKISFTNLLGNKILTFMTNLMFMSNLSDMETCYKAMHKDVVGKLNLKSDGFEIEGEITGKILKNGYRIKEVPIRYIARTKEAGKKIKVFDGVKTLIVLIKVRLGLL